MTELSPAAKAVLIAAIEYPSFAIHERTAAALRALAGNSAASVFACHEPVVLVSRILAIANELHSNETT
jgi:hypothetical protein